MLILTRRIGERLMIGNDVVVTVLGVNGKQIRLGVVAPEDVVVDREEVYHKKQVFRAIQNEKTNHPTNAYLKEKERKQISKKD